MNENKNLPKDVFTHLLSIITLYISCIGLITLLFQYINLFFPDALSPIYYSGVADSIRWAMASLFIVFPVYLVVMKMLDSEYQSSPEKRELKIRKWLVYFTLWAAALIIIGDLITLVYNFLGGDITMRFVLKIFVILAVIGEIFAYYLLDLRRKLSQSSKRIFLWGTVSAVIICAVFGFFTAGSPFKARLYRFDEQRVGDLQNIQYQVIEYWVQKQALPSSLGDLKNDITGFIPPTDPETNLSYIYRINIPKKIDNSGIDYEAIAKKYGGTSVPLISFDLCTTFNLSSFAALNVPKTAPAQYYEPYMQNWDHEQGEKCYTRTIDPQLYRDRISPQAVPVKLR